LVVGAHRPLQAIKRQGWLQRQDIASPQAPDAPNWDVTPQKTMEQAATLCQGCGASLPLARWAAPGGPARPGRKRSRANPNPVGRRFGTVIQERQFWQFAGFARFLGGEGLDKALKEMYKFRRSIQE
jgi:hypothetical protein